MKKSGTMKDSEKLKSKEKKTEFQNVEHLETNSNSEDEKRDDNINDDFS